MNETEYRAEIARLRIELEEAQGEVAYWEGQAAWFRSQARPGLEQVGCVGKDQLYETSADDDKCRGNVPEDKEAA